MKVDELEAGYYWVKLCLDDREWVIAETFGNEYGWMITGSESMHIVAEIGSRITPPSDNK